MSESRQRSRRIGYLWSRMVLHNVLIQGAQGRPLLLDVYAPSDRTSGVVFFLHGFKGFKDWGPFHLVARAFQQAGLMLVKFNFSHNGTTPQRPTEFADLDAFARNNPLLELADTEAVMNYIVQHYFRWTAQEVEQVPFYVVGHSRGGALALLFAGREARITKVVTWAAVKGFGTLFTKEQIDRWKADGVRYEFNQRTGQQMPVYYQYWETLQQHRSELDVAAAVAAINKPVLVLHGSEDQSVPVAHAEAIGSYNHKWVQVKILQGADHTFGGRHPWTSEHLPEALQAAVQDTLDFLQNQNALSASEPTVLASSRPEHTTQLNV
ncbi:MAG: alpha/beta fold hydrolase [Chitinophagales bacterium]|nr:alpha/beta fold hydrolase [Chitinophagales bacterium]MDW8392898.1 alpha/beta fold hydrolase [Chitinophagales bacterium]